MIQQAVQTDLSAHFDRDMPFQERAIFAGGCFWCMVEPFVDLPGITAVTSGYTGGHSAHPTYEHVIGGYTGHVEAVEIIFDTRKMSYAALVALYFHLTDPTDALGQFQDRGSQYRPVIFVKDDTQRQIAEAAKAELAASGVICGQSSLQLNLLRLFGQPRTIIKTFIKRIRSAIRWLNGRAASFFNFSVHKATCG